MQIAEAFIAIRQDRAEIARRACWHPERYCFAMVGAEGERYVHLTSARGDATWPFVPHSVDVRATDWEVF